MKSCWVTESAKFMDGVEICIILVVVCLIWAVVQFAIDHEKKEQQKQHRKDTLDDEYLTVRDNKLVYPNRMRFGDENIYVDEWKEFNSLSERERDRILGGKVQQFWDRALEYSIRYIEEKDFESLSEFLANIWETRDLVESADDLHTLTENVIERLYPDREIPRCRELIYTLCRLVLSNADNYRRAGRYHVWLTPTKLAILLEKDKRIDEAIEVCDICISKNISDRGYASFDERKARLLTKKAKK